MTDSTPASHSRTNSQSTPFVETVATPNASEANRYATHSVERSKRGRGTLIALLVVAPLLVAAIIFTYAALFLGKMNSDSERGVRERGNNTTQPRSP